MASSVTDCEEPRCRLCWGDENEGNGKLISPCNCRGSMGYIHIECLKHWLETTRQQGRSRRTVNRCEICHSKYRTGIRTLDESDQLQLMPSPLHDPFTIASIIHGSYRAYVAISGLIKAYTIYRSIEFKAGPPGSAASTSGSAAGFGMSSSTGSLGMRGPRWQQQQQPRRELPLRHLSVSIPIGGGAVQQAGGAEVLAEVRARFDKATMVQVYWYTSLMAATPQPPNADAFAGMALGATIGGIMAQMIFLPLLGAGKLSALGYGCNLLRRCLIRLLAAELCGARGYRLVAAAVRAVMQGHRQWGRRLRQQLLRLRLGARNRPALPAAAAVDADLWQEAHPPPQQQQQQQQRQQLFVE